MKDIIFIFLIFLMIFHWCSRSPSNMEKIRELDLTDKNYKIVVFDDDRGGVYASDFFVIYKINKKDSTKYEVIETVRYDDYILELIRLNKTYVGFVRKYRFGSDTIKVKLD